MKLRFFSYNLLHLNKRKVLDSLKIHFQNWESYPEHETYLLRGMTIRESLQQYQEMQSTFEWQMQQTAGLFEENHRQVLIEIQARLLKLAQWQSANE